MVRLRVTGGSILNRSGIGHNEFTANGEQCLNCLSQPRGQPHRVAVKLAFWFGNILPVRIRHALSKQLVLDFRLVNYDELETEAGRLKLAPPGEFACSYTLR